MPDIQPHRIPFSQIDAFASRAFEGNSAAVIVLDDWLEDGLLQSIALEMNLSETAFLVACPNTEKTADFELRWFTPTVEVEMCGHATLASGFHILSGDPSRHEVRFQTRHVGVLTVERTEAGFTLDLPAWPSEEAERPDIAEALGSPPATIRARIGGIEDSFIAVYDSADAVRGLQPDFGRLGALGNMLFVATAPGGANDDTDVVSRVFVPGAGIDEDPVTGSAHAFLAPYWAERLGRSSFTAYQASSRGGRLACDLKGDRVILSGTCVKTVDGVIYL